MVSYCGRTCSAVVISAIFAFLVFSAPASANDAQTVIDACRTVKNQEKRIQCLESATRLASKPPLTPPPQAALPPTEKSDEDISKERSADIKARWDSTFRAATAIKSATDVGLSRMQYGTYVQQLATEVAVATAKAKYMNEKEASSLYQEAIDAYTDAGKFWDTCISFYSHGPNGMSYGGGLPLELTGMGWYADRYGVPTQKADIWGLNRGVPCKDGVTVVWSFADRQVSIATGLLEQKANPSQ